MAQPSSLFLSVKWKLFSFEEDCSDRSMWTYATAGCVGFVAGYATHAFLSKISSEDVHPQHGKRDIRVSELYIYPIKGCKGVKVDNARITPRGFENDRLFVIVDSTDRFISQRKFPVLALISPELSNDASKLTLSAPGMDKFHVNVKKDGNHREVTVWNDVCDAVDQGDEVGRWLSTFLDQPGIRLVRMAEGHVRPVPKSAKHIDSGKHQVSFADRYQYLITSAESHALVSDECKEFIPRNRFRPNIVVSGTESPFEEDNWSKITIGKTTFYPAVRCDRCKVPTVNQETGIITGPEPTKTLKRLKNEKLPFFGVLLVTSSVEHIIHTGDPVYTSARKKLKFL